MATVATSTITPEGPEPPLQIATKPAGAVLWGAKRTQGASALHPLSEVWCRSDLLPHQAGVSVTSCLCGVGSLSNKPRESHTAGCRGGARSLTPGKEGGEEKQSAIRTEEGQRSALVPTANQQFKTKGKNYDFCHQ